MCNIKHDLLTELDSAAIRVAAAATALQRAHDHPKSTREDRKAIQKLQDMCRALAGDIMDQWSVTRAREVEVQRGRESEVAA